MHTHITKKVSVIIPTYERCDSVRRALIALSNQTFPTDQFEVIISIDGSKDGTRSMVNNFNSAFRLRSIWKSNSGRASARNSGIREAEGEIILLLDDDMEPSPALVEAHYSSHTDGQRLGVIGPTPIVINERTKSIGRHIAKGFNTFIEQYLSDPEPKILLDDFYGGNFSIRRDLLLEAGAFNESFKLYGYEDTELVYRLFKSGVKVIFNKKAICSQYYEEDFRGLARKTISKGKMMILFVNLHPDTFNQLILHEYKASGWKWHLLRLVLIRLSMFIPATTEAIIRIVSMFEKSNSDNLDKIYSLALDYLLWLGIWSELNSDKNNQLLIQKIKSYV